jgi:hypothetical protein
VVPPELKPAPNALQPIESQKEWKGAFHWPQPSDPQVLVEHRVAEGDAPAEILLLAEAVKCDLIVMGTHGRTGMRRLLTGSVAEDVLRKATCPILIVRTPSHDTALAETQMPSSRSSTAVPTEKKATAVQLKIVRIEKPDDTNFILGQTHFIKSVEDIHDALVTAVHGIKFGMAFCEASGKCLVRWSGTDAAMIELAKSNAAAIGAGHSFVVFLGDGFYPLNVLNTLKMVPEVCRIFCATANPSEVVLAETEQGRGILGVVDGFSPKGVEDEDEIKWRKDFLRQINYKR